MAAPMYRFRLVTRVITQSCTLDVYKPFRCNYSALRTNCLLAYNRHDRELYQPEPELLHTNLLQSFTRPLSITSRCWSDETDEGNRVNKFKKEITDDDVEEGIAYMQSEEYAKKYGKKPVWTNYRRNHKGQVPKMKTRESCTRGQWISGNPCPICRDQNLVVHYKNVKLLEQFVNQDSWLIFEAAQTGLCQKSYKKVVAAVGKARDYGLMPFTVPYVKYSYREFYGRQNEEQKSSGSS